MIYSDFKELKLSKLGFGLMRLPVKDDGSINEEELAKMVEYAISHGVNYFDTAYPYHKGYSEIAIGKILKKYPRESFYLADKYPGHQIAPSYNPKEIFEEQLKKCQVDYFDFYLLHNVYENSIKTYTSDEWKIIDYFVEQRRLGRIKHLGFSTHGRLELIDEFLKKYHDVMEFCQIQFNYLDYTLQNAKEKYELVTSYNIPVWVMEPVRGGRLCLLDDESTKVLQDLNPNYSLAAWCFKFVQSFPNVKVILSGMTNFDQMKDNIQTFEDPHVLNEKEMQALLDIAEKLKDSIPCTTCRYCLAGCPMGLNIPLLINAYNDIKFNLKGALMTTAMLEALPKDKLPENCISCGACSHICPQKINVPEVLSKLNEMYQELPKWENVCQQRLKESEELKKKS